MHRSDREIKRIQKQIAPIYSRLKRTVLPMQKGVLNGIEREADKILDEYAKAANRDEKTRLKREYARLINNLIGQDKFKAVEQKILDAIHEADTEALRKIEQNKYKTYAENYNRIGRGLKKDLNDYNFKPIDEDDAQYASLTNKKIDKRKLDRWNRERNRNAWRTGALMMVGVDVITELTVTKLIDGNHRMSDRQVDSVIIDAGTLGELDSMERADDEGFTVMKYWIATLDNRTRDSHVELDGVRIPLDAEFKEGLSRPLDPNGDPAEICNCRCDLGYDTGGRRNRTRAARQGVVSGSYKNPESFNNTHTVTVPNMTYKEWQKWRSR